MLISQITLRLIFLSWKYISRKCARGIGIYFFCLAQFAF